jgi:hypothetical protein
VAQFDASIKHAVSYRQHSHSTISIPHVDILPAAVPDRFGVLALCQVDMMSVFSMMYGASGVAATPLGGVLNMNTAMTVISGE